MLQTDFALGKTIKEMEFKGRGHQALTGEECYFRAKWVSGVRTRLNTAGVRPPTHRHKMQDLNIHARSHKSSNTHMKGLLRDTHTTLILSQV